MIQLEQLVKETLLYTQQTHLISLPPPTLGEKKEVVVKKKIEVKQEVIETKKESASKASPPSLIEKIQRHLPYVKLIQKPPSANQVALICFFPEDLPFLKNLAKAIQEKLCPVKLLDGKKVALPFDGEGFSLVITQKTVRKEELLLEPIEHYQQNPQKKKLLWKELCDKLSPKSS